MIICDVPDLTLVDHYHFSILSCHLYLLLDNEIKEVDLISLGYSFANLKKKSCIYNFAAQILKSPIRTYVYKGQGYFGALFYRTNCVVGKHFRQAFEHKVFRGGICLGGTVRGGEEQLSHGMILSRLFWELALS